MADQNKPLSKEHFVSILEQATKQVFAGKGDERHGHGTPFDQQPWVTITENVGTGFVLGQAMKKLMELRAFSDLPAWKREALGAIVYTTMAIMYREYEDAIKKEEDRKEEEG